MPAHTRQCARQATRACAPGSATGEAQPSTPKRKASKRGGARRQEAANDAVGLTGLSKDLLLCVVRFIFKPAVAQLAAGGRRKASVHGPAHDGVKAVAALLCVSTRFARDLKADIATVVREEVKRLCNGAVLDALPEDCNSWHHLLWLLPTRDDVAVSFRWRIADWAAVSAGEVDRCRSTAFYAGGLPWRLLIFPRGNPTPPRLAPVTDHVSLYVEYAGGEPTEPAAVDDARIALTVLRSAMPPAPNASRPQFTQCEGNSWGFPHMLHLDELANPARGWVAEDGALTVEVLFAPTRAAVDEPFATLSWTGEATLGVNWSVVRLQ